MKLLNLGRQGGKTTACLEWLNANRNGAIVTANAVQRDDLVKALVRDYGETTAYWNIRVINYGNEQHRGRGPLVIDNAESILQQIYSGQIVGITGTFEEW